MLDAEIKVLTDGENERNPPFSVPEYLHGEEPLFSVPEYLHSPPVLTKFHVYYFVPQFRFSNCRIKIWKKNTFQLHRNNKLPMSTHNTMLSELLMTFNVKMTLSCLKESTYLLLPRVKIPYNPL
jgi:hypothetical protein